VYQFNVIVEERVSVSKAPRQLKTRGVSHCGLAIYILKKLRQKKNYENSNISPCKNIISKKSFKRN
jgi:hypothetical protein